MKKYQIFISVLLSLFSSCSFNEIDVKIPPADNLLVVNSFFSPNKVWEVSVNKLTGILNKNDTNTFIENANVKLFKNGKFEEVLINIKQGIYVSKTGNKPTVGNMYHIEVTAPNYKKTVSSKEKIPKKLTFKSITFERSLNRNKINIDADLYNYYKDLSYTFSYQFNDFFNDTSCFSIDITNDFDTEVYPVYSEKIDITKSLFVASVWGEIKEADKKENYFFLQVKDEQTKELLCDTINLNLYSFSKSFYKYFETISAQDFFINYSKPVGIFTNIENGVGIFAGYNSKRYTIIIDEN